MRECLAERLTTTEAAMRLGFDLAHGMRFSNAEAALLTGLTVDGAYRMLCRGAREIPIRQARHDGKWEMIPLTSE